MNVLIVGAGPAGVTVAETLRQHDREARITMLSEEPFPPYSPPALAEYFISGRKVHFWRGEDFAEKQGIVYRQATRVRALLPAENRIELDNGKTMDYDRLVLAPGGRLYAPIEGADQEGVYNFKSLSAGEELLGRLRKKKAKSVLIVGAGFIGVEIALVLRELGLEVTLLVRSRVMRQMLDEDSAEAVLGMLLDKGIQVHRGEAADAVGFLGTGQACAVKMRSGDEVRADLYVAATGLRPNIEFLEGSGIDTKWGILVDPQQRTNLPNVFAAGDAAETMDLLSGERYVHAIFPNAVSQGRIVAYNLLGWEAHYEGSESMNSLKHLGLPVMAIGSMEGEEVRQRNGAGLRKLYFRDGRLVGCRLVGDIRAAGIYHSLINRKCSVEAFRDRLLEPRFGVGVQEGLALAGIPGS
jgi:NADPH-dependent 2,4-dienoyl-CoA reductase/sulfur reductase-like enzyme